MLEFIFCDGLFDDDSVVKSALWMYIYYGCEIDVMECLPRDTMTKPPILAW